MPQWLLGGVLCGRFITKLKKSLKSPTKRTFCSSLVIRQKHPQNPFPFDCQEVHRQAEAQRQWSNPECADCLLLSHWLSFLSHDRYCPAECGLKQPADGSGRGECPTGRQAQELPLGWVWLLTLYWEHVLWGGWLSRGWLGVLQQLLAEDVTEENSDEGHPP